MGDAEITAPVAQDRFNLWVALKAFGHAAHLPFNLLAGIIVASA
ncbi:hypothetical protein N2599_37135 (plasmid) [Rhizobium sullae]|uniref:Uncharacterized protein n=1 Tax=Rhizobium sullae TaxID=50338 RepID=A0ABY5XY87_RHISU|nr:hypothetical protein [Rhizobium sullae]UWU19468.1 hypothetical protein N2599_37135 [Rhizobium sullae]